MLGDTPATGPKDCAGEVLEVLETVRDWITTAEADNRRGLGRASHELPPPKLVCCTFLNLS